MRINGETHYLWRAVDHEGEVLEDGTYEILSGGADDGESAYRSMSITDLKVDIKTS